MTSTYADQRGHDVAWMTAAEREAHDVAPDAHALTLEPDPTFPHLNRAHCSCGWHSAGYTRMAQYYHARHVAGLRDA